MIPHERLPHINFNYANTAADIWNWYLLRDNSILKFINND